MTGPLATLLILTAGALLGLALAMAGQSWDRWMEDRAERRALRRFDAMRRECRRG